MQRWEGMFTAGLRAHLVTCRFGLPVILPQPGGLVIQITITPGQPSVLGAVHAALGGDVYRWPACPPGHLPVWLTGDAPPAGWPGDPDHHHPGAAKRFGRSPCSAGRGCLPLACVPTWSPAGLAYR